MGPWRGARNATSSSALFTKSVIWAEFYQRATNRRRASPNPPLFILAATNLVAMPMTYPSGRSHMPLSAVDQGADSPDGPKRRCMKLWRCSPVRTRTAWPLREAARISLDMKILSAEAAVHGQAEDSGRCRFI